MLSLLSLLVLLLVSLVVLLQMLLLWSCGGFTHRHEDWRGKPLSPPTEIDALYGLLFASFYYLYLQARALVCIPFPIARGRTRAVNSCVCSVGAGW